tara:strand:- start:594 stop:803 length:210 start_codon:yes stop_codon:yes gene_type:complete
MAKGAFEAGMRMAKQLFRGGKRMRFHAGRVTRSRRKDLRLGVKRVGESRYYTSQFIKGFDYQVSEIKKK